MVQEKSLRLFFALPCPPEQAAAICDWRDQQAFGGRPVPNANLHMTLAFLGAQPAGNLQALLRLANGIDCQSFELELNELITLGEGFVCLRPQRPPAALMQLSADLTQRLTALGVALDSRPYLPHLTLARHAKANAHGPAASFSWRAERFVLYQSQNTASGVRYAELGSWPLRAPKAD